MSTPKIHCADGINAVIPEHLTALQINAAWLKSKAACYEGYAAFDARFPDGALYPKVRAWIAGINRQDWESWMQLQAGGDVATAGHSGTATAGDSGTATAGDRGTATAGENGVISIEYYDSQAGRRKRMIGYVGEGGLRPGVKYRLNEHDQFEEVEP